jgi:putative phosphoribosyl transferase
MLGGHVVMYTRFRHRQDAGRALAAHLQHYAHQPDVIVLGLPRGGVPVAFEVAQSLHAPLDIWLVRKLGLPHHPELAMGAIASEGVCVLNPNVLLWQGIPKTVIDQVAAAESIELERRRSCYQGNRPLPVLTDKTILLVDDGMATGSTLRAALASLRQHTPKRIVVAVPVAAPSTCEALANEVDEMICLLQPEPLYSISAWYEDFSQVSDETVRMLLQTAQRELTELTTSVES